MADTGAGKSPRDRHDLSAVVRRWLAVGAFVLGLFAGGIAVGLLGATASTPPDGGAGPATAGRSGPGAVPTTGVAVVDAACLRALNAAQDVYGALDGLGSAAAELDAAGLDEIVRRLQPLQARLGGELGACHVTPASGSPVPTGTAPPSSTGAPVS